AAAPTEISLRLLALPRSTVSAPSVTARTPPTNMSLSRKCPNVRQFWQPYSQLPKSRKLLVKKLAHVALPQIIRSRLHHIVVIAVQHVPQRGFRRLARADLLQNSLDVPHATRLHDCLDVCQRPGIGIARCVAREMHPGTFELPERGALFRFVNLHERRGIIATAFSF